MSEGALDRVAEAQQALIRALDGADAAVVEAAAEALRAALSNIRNLDLGAASGAAPRVRAKLAELAAQAGAAQARVNFLTDGIARRIEGLAAARGVSRAATYGPLAR
jgi:hypothetical protein